MEFVSKHLMTVVFVIGTAFQIKFCADFYEWKRGVTARLEVQRARAEELEMYMKYVLEHGVFN